MTKKILVTGAAGYIGAHTAVALWEAGFEPIIVDNFSKSDDTLLKGLEKIMKRKPIFYQGDCCDEKFLHHVFDTEKTITAVIHFAAYKSVAESVRKPLLYFQNNIYSLLTLLNVMKEKKVTDFIFSSSCTVYGQPDVIPVAEDAPFKKAESPYGATKQACEIILDSVSKENFRIISLRYFNPIGAHPSAEIGELILDVPSYIVPYITQTAIGKREKVTVFGNDYDTPDGSCIRDYVHIMDLADGHVKALQYLNNMSASQIEIFNLGTGQGNSVLEIVRSFQEVTGVKLNVEIGARRSGDVEKVFANPAKAVEKLKWKPIYTLQDGLKHAWAWEKKVHDEQKK